MAVPVTFQRVVSAPQAAQVGSERAAIVVGTLDKTVSGHAPFGAVTQLDNQAEADAKLGTDISDTLALTAKIWFDLLDAPLLVVPYDDTQTGNALTTAITAAVDAIGTAHTRHGLKPHLGAVGHEARSSATDTASNTLATHLATAMDAEGGMGFVTGATAADDADNYAANNFSTHYNLYIAHQDVTSTDATNAVPGSIMMMILRAWLDAERGIITGMHNETVPHVTTVAPIVTPAQAYALEDQGVTTFVNFGGSWRLWGGKTQLVTDDDIYRDGYVRRIGYEIEDRLAAQALHYIGRAYRGSQIAEGLNQVMVNMTEADGLLTGGSAALDSARNAAETDPSHWHILWDAAIAAEARQIQVRGHEVVVRP